MLTRGLVGMLARLSFMFSGRFVRGGLFGTLLLDTDDGRMALELMGVGFDCLRVYGAIPIALVGRLTGVGVCTAGCRRLVTPA
jgi:hypothetical protein